jgi:hypothetical protein
VPMDAGNERRLALTGVRMFAASRTRV